MCVMALYGPDCNAAQPVCMGSGNWNTGFREPSWERIAVDYVQRVWHSRYE